MGPKRYSGIGHACLKFSTEEFGSLSMCLRFLGFQQVVIFGWGEGVILLRAYILKCKRTLNSL